MTKCEDKNSLLPAQLKLEIESGILALKEVAPRLCVILTGACIIINDGWGRGFSKGLVNNPLDHSWLF